MTGTRLGQVPGVDAAAERPVALALARVNYYHSACEEDRYRILSVT
jgi:hypothetical protein